MLKRDIREKEAFKMNILNKYYMEHIMKNV